ncbi:hypothetical protein HWV62_14076 [Athelia sp. TMB]|nr:hypothetical protein HWV62_14076 [Athelia sp. TMB]
MAATPSVHQLFRRLETVGKGAYGSVHKGVHIPTGNIVALKIINLDTADDDVADIQREVTLLTQLRDAPNVTKYYGCYLDGPRVWIAMEFAGGGSVRTLMKASRGGILEEKYIVIIVREVLVGLSYLHKSAIIHRDIKAANILVTTTGKVMICDFGVSALSATTSSKRNTLMGTPNWMAPEVAQPVPAYDSKADIWSLGIVVYEMVKGTPPHADLGDPLKVMSLITRVKPPRLAEGEGSKDMRDFVTSCLRELPSDRLAADELSKSKWIKSSVKEKISVLRDLILRYDTWMQGGGTRMSIADPLDWEQEEENDLREHVPKEENPWEFETVRGKSFTEASSMDDSYEPPSEESVSSPNTVRPRPSARLPSSLRGLFDDDTATSESEFFRPPLLQVPGPRSTPSPPSISPSPSPSRDRMSHKRPMGAEGSLDEMQTAKSINFAFPPRTSTPRSKSKLSTNAPGSEDEEYATLVGRRERPPPLGPGISLPSGPSPVPTENPNRARGHSFRERSASRGLANIEIPPPLPLDRSDDVVSVDSPDNFPSAATETSAQGASSSKPAINRKRSQSSITGLTSRAALANHRDRDLASPGDFQFPSSGGLSPMGARRGTHLKASPSASSASSFLSITHHPARSYDETSSSLPRRRLPPVDPLPLPPSIHRAHSANATPAAADNAEPVLRKPSLSRQASVAVMEHVQALPPLVPPSKPFARSARDRSNSGSSRLSDGNISTQSLGLPGLKDVIKIPELTSEYQLGMSDLLPPSPSTANYSSRVFAPSPSALSSSVVNNADRAAFNSLANASTTSLGLTRTHSPPFDSSRPNLHNNVSHNGSVSAFGLNGPAVRPLDFGALMISHENTHSELAKTVEDLSQWLSLVEVGLSAMLDFPAEDTIAEEQEEQPIPQEDTWIDASGSTSISTSS